MDESYQAGVSKRLRTKKPIKHIRYQIGAHMVNRVFYHCLVGVEKHFKSCL